MLAGYYCIVLVLALAVGLVGLVVQGAGSYLEFEEDVYGRVIILVLAQVWNISKYLLTFFPGILVLDSSHKGW